jgi:hypothetical protein
MSMGQAWRAHLRLSILRLLAETPGYSANESLVTDVLRDDLGFGCSRDQVRTELRWLEEQGLLHAPETAGLKIATVTDRGVDVAAGRAVVDGVKRPSPRG